MDPRRLREETRTEHEATEALMPLTDNELTRSTYVRTLEILFPLITSWEVWAREKAPDALRDLLPARRRGHLLAADLEAMGSPLDHPSCCDVDWDSVMAVEAGHFPQSAPEAAFLGALYVIEGSTLGGRYIARHVEAVLGLVPGQGDSYFRGHGDSTGVLWREVTARIAELPEVQDALVIGAARNTFGIFGQRLRLGYSVQARRS